MNKKIETAAKIIKRIEYINIASITPEGMPWNTPVYTSFDKNLNFYWLSWKKNQHSINVRNNGNVFVTIYDSTTPAGTGVGLYFSGKAKELINPAEMLIGITVIYKREKHKMRAIKEFLTHFPRRVYRFTPEKIWINGDSDISGNFIDIREELDLSKIKEKL
ncbi:MAG: Pyridoxamine 5'-phosphate oxidase-related, FMN-binding protein [Candidatus Roizmanbacteria bacterium GW2011_GWC2_37_13]|uniref:Pyridoxamine 5'-phosphate oxidase-related, FMN-binding protein n=1 Tax=Candidatus Roizmanbacteria bacterium GW2011_GWC2_37_13 TaxID=1618486 RepID=A0A0G0GH77_9BACT|nr:MAG: Pyridoxamine 5'-phosphate oxidase-related, FMN-binding protein [Candidatus Roizmanbacteria bacterium GW2011_GWC1_37_12]KKQ25440.1 MAG: Pyridoxamine 5'-phosphate oxidase-related, FMN-binding protein [Candidatus Roizmanbacteria bacterium GW2011_GWC2_37_13]